jgi:hypothetical protein
MPMQRKMAEGGDRLAEPAAAVQHDFPEVDISGGQIRQNPNRSFAVRVPCTKRRQARRSALILRASRENGDDPFLL